MILGDTSIWIEYLKANIKYFNLFKTHLEKNTIIAFSPIFAELLQGAKNKYELNIIKGYWFNLPKFNEDNIFITAGELSNKENYINKGIGIIDSAIIVYANINNLKVWSLDKKINKILKKNEIFSDY